MFELVASRPESSHSAGSTDNYNKYTVIISALCPNIISNTADASRARANVDSHRSVLGYILLSRGQPVSIIRHSGVIFDGEQGQKYASAIGRIVESVRADWRRCMGAIVME